MNHITLEELLNPVKVRLNEENTLGHLIEIIEELSKLPKNYIMELRGENLCYPDFVSQKFVVEHDLLRISIGFNETTGLPKNVSVSKRVNRKTETLRVVIKDNILNLTKMKFKFNKLIFNTVAPLERLEEYRPLDFFFYTPLKQYNFVQDIYNKNSLKAA